MHNNHAANTSKNTAEPSDTSGSPKANPDPEPASKAGAPNQTGKPSKPPGYSAAVLRQTTYAEHLRLLLEPHFGNYDGNPAFMNMMGEIFIELGCPNHPLAKMLIQQLVFYHELIPAYHVQAVKSPSLEVKKVMFAAAHKMTDDHRKATTQLIELIELIQSTPAAPAKPGAATTSQQAVKPATVNADNPTRKPVDQPVYRKSA